MEKRIVFNNGNSKWLPQETETVDLQSLQKEYGLDETLLSYTVDSNERARVTFDETDECLLLIYNVPHKLTPTHRFKTSPVAFIIKDRHLFTFTSQDTAFVQAGVEEILARNNQLNEYQLLFETLFYLTDAYFPLIEEVNDERIRLNSKLRKRTTNKNILELSDLSISLIYLVTATKQNVVLLEQVKALEVYRSFSEADQDQLNDALIEAKQALEMTLLASQILDQLASTYNNLLNNNLNDTMKFLTVWSLLLTVPTIVTGFFGMNVDLPFSDSAFGWLIALLISLALSIWMVLLLWRRIR